LKFKINPISISSADQARVVILNTDNSDS
jgi:hypothetical protein